MTGDRQLLPDVLAQLHKVVDGSHTDTARLIRTRRMDAATSDTSEETDAELAIVLLALGHDRAGAVLKWLADPELKELARAVVRTGNVSPKEICEAAEAFETSLRQGEFAAQGGWDFTEKLLSAARDEEYSKRVTDELGSEEGRTRA